MNTTVCTVAGALALGAFTAAAAPDLVVDIDFNDEVFMRKHPITEAEVEKLVRDLHGAGVQTLLVRMGYLGFLPYRTTLTYPIGFDFADAHAHPLHRNVSKEETEKYIASHSQANERYVKVLESFNPPEVFIRVGHELGMKVVMWIDIFDDYYPGFRSKFLDEHPYCQWTARDGKTYFKGLTSYAWPEARAFRVAQAKELLDMGADGIHCSTSAHCRHLPNVQGNDVYGFEQPVVDEFKKRYGVDIRTAPEFDKEAWHTIKGEFMNQLYRDLANVCHARKKELWIGLQLGTYTHLAASPYFSDNVVARYRNLWKPLVDERIADVFVLGDYEIVTNPALRYWRAKGLAPEPGKDLFSWAAGEYGGYCRGKTRLYLFSEWLVNSPEALDHRLAQWAERVMDNGFDGIDMHEAMNFESCPGGMDLLKRLKDRLAGKKVGPLK